MIEFTVIGTPVGKGRPKFSTVNGFAVAYTPKKTESYENLVKLSVQQQQRGLKPFDKDVPLQADIIAYFPIPKSTSKKKREAMLNGEIYHTKKPDADNITKSILDALNGIAYYDDSQVVYVRCKKSYSDEPRAEIIIREI